MKKIYILLTSVLFAFNFTEAQYANQQTFYNNVPQARYTNIGIMPEYKGYFSIPLLSGYGITASNSGFAFKDLFNEGSISPESFVESIGKKNLLNFGNSLDVIAFGFKAGKNFISFNVTPKTDFNLGYNRSFFDFLLNGNAGYIGKSISLDGFSFDVSAYVETGIGYTREINEKLSAGGRLKYLSGLGNVNGDFDGISLYTDEDDYSLTANSNFSINAYGTFFADSEIAESMGNPAYFNPKNLGLGIDLGANYQFSENLQFFASIVDLGYLKWSEYGETLYNDSSSFKFEGLPLDELLGSSDGSAKDISDLSDDLMDTLSSTFNLERSQTSYITGLKTKIYMGAYYKLNDYIDFQGMLHGRVYNNKIYPMYMFSGGINLKKWLTAKLTYSGVNRTYDNIGAGLVLNAGAFQFYTMLDNIYGLTQIDYTRNLAGSFGLNIVFHKKDDKKLKRSKGKKSKSENKKEKAENKKEKAEKNKEKAEKKKEKANDNKEKAEKKKERAENSKEKVENKRSKSAISRENTEENKKNKEVKAKEKSLKSAAKDVKKEEKELKKEIKEVKDKEKELKSEAKEIKDDVKELKKETKEIKAKEKQLKSEVKEGHSDSKEIKKEIKEVKAKEKELKSAVKEEKSVAKEIKKEIKEVKAKEKELKSAVKDEKSEAKEIKREIKELRANDNNLKSEHKEIEKGIENKGENKEVVSESTPSIQYSEIDVKDSIVKFQTNDVEYLKDSVPAMSTDSLGIRDSLKLEPKGGGL